MTNKVLMPSRLETTGKIQSIDVTEAGRGCGSPPPSSATRTVVYFLSRVVSSVVTKVFLLLYIYIVLYV